ncbi:MAG TPA: Snf2 family helicase, partial [Enterococcus faecalis]|nr:Snf2 family helicase [Enterococcus faecalis]
NRRVLLFSQFTSMLSILEKELNELGLETFYLRGSTKPQDRLTMANAFNEGEKDVFLISLKAGGTGLNLTGADTVILYDLWWNPAVEEQAAGRAHRMGQKKVVEVWRMIAEGTVEEKMNSLQQEKRELFQKVIQGNEEQLAKMTEEDIRTILSIGE